MSPILRFRQAIVSIHVLTAGFFFPVAVMFAITGGLYTFGIKGNYDNKKIEVSTELPAQPTLAELEVAAKNILAEHNGGSLPTGNQNLRKVGTSWQFEWTGTRFDFTLDPTATVGSYTAVIKTTTWHRFFVQLHKAKGGFLFKVIAGGLAIGFIILFLGGALLAFAHPKLKQQFFVSFVLGAIVFIVGAFLS